jgi:hypothetical protein
VNIGGFEVDQSAAELVKQYLEKYILINELKIKNHKYKNLKLARLTRYFAFDIIRHMSELIETNHANNFDEIYSFLKSQEQILRKLCKKVQYGILGTFLSESLPSDFEKCLHAAEMAVIQCYRSHDSTSPSKNEKKSDSQ